MVHVIARITVKADFAELGKRVLAELAKATRGEPGCLSYDLFQRADALHVFQTVERWIDQPTVAAHMTSPHIAAAVETLTPALATAPEIHTFMRIV